MSKTLSAYTWRLIFTVAYTLVVIPFTINFFSTIVTLPPTTATLFKLFPLTETHKIMLPLFLGAIEFASVSLACSFWVKTNSSRKALLIILFLACQTLPVMSVYFDVRSRDYSNEMDSQQSALFKAVDPRKSIIDASAQAIQTEENRTFTVEQNAIAQIGSQILQKTNLLTSIRSQITQLNNLSVQALPMSEDTLQSIRDEKRTERNRISNEISELRKQENSLNSEITALESEGRVIQNQLKSKTENRIITISNLREAQRTQQEELKSLVDRRLGSFNYSSALEYIVREAFTYKSFFAFFISLIFPISVLAIAFVLPKVANSNDVSVPSFQLSDYLSHGEKLPTENHLNYARLLVPSLNAYIIALKASKTIANENVILNLRDNLINQIILQLCTLKHQILSSRIDEDAKNLLLNEIRKISKHELIT